MSNKRTNEQRTSSEASLDAPASSDVKKYVYASPAKRKRRYGLADDSLMKGNPNYFGRNGRYLLLACVKEFPELWDVFSPSYTLTSRAYRWELWEDIALFISAKTNLVVSRYDAQEHWRWLRDGYVKRRREGNMASRSGRFWKFYSALNFMDNNFEIMERYGLTMIDMRNRSCHVEVLAKEENRRKTLSPTELMEELQREAAKANNSSFGVWPHQSRAQISAVAKEIRETGHTTKLDNWVEEQVQVQEQTNESYNNASYASEEAEPDPAPATLTDLFMNVPDSSRSSSSVLEGFLNAEVKQEEEEDFINTLPFHSDSFVSTTSQVSATEQRTAKPPPPTPIASTSKNHSASRPQRQLRSDSFVSAASEAPVSAEKTVNPAPPIARPSRSKKQCDVRPQRKVEPATVPVAVPVAVPVVTEPTPTPVPVSVPEREPNSVQTPKREPSAAAPSTSTSSSGTFSLLEEKYAKWKTEDSRFADEFESSLMMVLLEHMHKFNQRSG